MSIADDPSQWLSKPRDNTMDKSMRGFTERDYHKLRDVMFEVFHATSSVTLRRILREGLQTTPANRDEGDKW